MVQPNLLHFPRKATLLVSMMLSSLFFNHQNTLTVTAFQATDSIHLFASSSQRIQTLLRAGTENTSNGSYVQESRDKGINQAKRELFRSLSEGDDADDSSSTLFRLHMPTKERTDLVADMTKTNPTPSPGSTKSFASLAPGIWRVVYAPHIATFGMVATKLLSVFFSLLSLLSNIIQKEDADDKQEIGDRAFSIWFYPVYYLLRADGSITSHARLVAQYPNSQKESSVTWFSVAGTYSSQDEDRVCRVDFDEAWVQTSENCDGDPLTLPPYSSLEQVPNGLVKTIIDALGRFFFIDAVSVFPVSYLDDDCIVFDFELLGTRILAKKVHEMTASENESDVDSVLQFLVDEER